MRNLLSKVLSLSLSGTALSFGGFWGVDDNDPQADATAPPPAPVATLKVKPGALVHKVVLGIASMNTEVASGNNGVFGYTLSYGITQRIGVSGGVGAFQGNFKDDRGTAVYETRGWFFPLQFNLQYALLSRQDMNMNIFGGGNFVYGTSRDKLTSKNNNEVLFEETSRANVYGFQLGMTAEKIFGKFGLSGFLMLQGIRGRISYPNFYFDVRDSYLLHGSVELIYLPFMVGLSLYHQRDFSGKGSVTQLSATYKF